MEHLQPVILSNLTDSEKHRSVVYLDGTVHEPGVFRIGSASVEVDHPFVAAFVDGKPGANWMHPGKYLLIDPKSHRVTQLDADRPPSFGPLPPEWSVVYRSPGVENWQLIPTTPRDTKKE